MKDTLHLTIYDPAADLADLRRAGQLLRDGGTVIIPTETVYGLAADAYNAQAVAAIFAAKGRPADNPLIVHIAALSQLEELAGEIPEAAGALAARFWPGPLTIILPKTHRVPMITTGGLDTVAVRMPESPVARAIIEEAGVPLAAPSANRSGRPSPTAYRHCREEMWGRVDAIVESEDCRVGVESTVVSLCGPVPAILRPGAVTPEELREVLGEICLDRCILEQAEADAEVRSPGMKYTHYSPLAEVILVEGDSGAFARYAAKEMGEGDWAMCFAEDAPGIPGPLVVYGGAADYGRQANLLFGTLRELDERGARRVFVHAPAPAGFGLAVYNRLIRAAGFQLVRL